MAIKYEKLTRANISKLKPGQKLNEHGIVFARLKNGDGVFKINVMVEGERIHRVVGRESDGTTRTTAEEYLEKLRQDAKNNRLSLPKGKKCRTYFADAGSSYLENLKKEGGKNLRVKELHLRLSLKPFFNTKPLDKISTTDIEQYKQFRLNNGVTKATINRELATLSHMYTKAIEWQWVDHRPFKVTKFLESNRRIIYLTNDQIEALLNEAKKDSCPHIYMFIRIGLETSMRLMEILSICILDIDFDKNTINIPKAKSGARQQPITQNLTSYLSTVVGSYSSNEKWLFPSKSSKSGHLINITKPFRRVVKNAGLNEKQVVRHTLRHTAITHLVQAGVDLPTVKRVSGHKTLSMVERYSHQNGAHIQAAMSKLTEKYGDAIV